MNQIEMQTLTTTNQNKKGKKNKFFAFLQKSYVV